MRRQYEVISKKKQQKQQQQQKQQNQQISPVNMQDFSSADVLDVDQQVSKTITLTQFFLGRCLPDLKGNFVHF